MNRKGQSLLEAMIATSILTVGFLGIIGLLSRSFFLGRVTSDQTTATYLAAEGVEIAKNIIDHDILVGNAWGACCTAGIYRVDYTSATLTPYLLPQANPQYIHFDPGTHRYSYSGSNTTNFNRWVVVTTPNANEIVVNGIVEWSTGSITSQNINLEDHFYNWHPR